MENKPHKLFISHSSKDAEYMKAFVDLLVAIGVHKNQITCTSVPQCNIPVGCNIYDWLAKQFQTSDLHVVYAFSDNYYSSVATLNERGAAWVMRCKWTGLLLPGFIFDKLAGCIDKNQICIKLDDPDIITLKQRLRQFRDDIIKEFGLESINEDEWEEKRDDFLDKIRIIAQKKNIEITSSESVNESNKTKGKTRFDAPVAQRQEIDLLKDYTPFSKVKPIISCGDEKVARIATFEDCFDMEVDISNVTKRDMREFAMALMKYIPCDNWTGFFDAGYAIEFDAFATGAIKKVQLEIKNDTGVKIIDEENDVSIGGGHFKYRFRDKVRNGEALEKISEVCFTIFFAESYIDGEKGRLSIRNLKVTPA